MNSPVLLCPAHVGIWSQRAWLLLPGPLLGRVTFRTALLSLFQRTLMLSRLQLSPFLCTRIMCSLPLPESFMESIWEHVVRNTAAHPEMSFHHSGHKGQWSVLGISLKGKGEHFSPVTILLLACRLSRMGLLIKTWETLTVNKRVSVTSGRRETVIQWQKLESLLWPWNSESSTWATKRSHTMN